jgi:hypothetical protein
VDTSDFLVPKLARTRGIVYYGSNERLRYKLAQMRQGHNLTIAAVGGSITAGVWAEGVPLIWVSRMVEHLRKARKPGYGQIHLANGAVPGTISQYMATCVRVHVPDDADVILVEYAMNEWVAGGWLGAGGGVGCVRRERGGAGGPVAHARGAGGARAGLLGSVSVAQPSPAQRRQVPVLSRAPPLLRPAAPGTRSAWTRSSAGPSSGCCASCSRCALRATSRCRVGRTVPRPVRTGSSSSSTRAGVACPLPSPTPPLRGPGLQFPRHPAVLLVNSFSYNAAGGRYWANSEAAYMEFATYYHLPAVSIKACCYHMMRAGRPGWMVSAGAPAAPLPRQPLRCAALEQPGSSAAPGRRGLTRNPGRQQPLWRACLVPQHVPHGNVGSLLTP